MPILGSANNGYGAVATGAWAAQESLVGESPGLSIIEGDSPKTQFFCLGSKLSDSIECQVPVNGV